MAAPRQPRASQQERIAAAALVGTLFACLLYAAELLFRPYATALASGEHIPYFARMMRGALAALLVSGIWAFLPWSWASWPLRQARWLLGLVLTVSVAVAVIYP